MDFFNNKPNDSLKFQIHTEGANLNDIEARLIFTTKTNKNYLLFGKIQEDKCIFEIPELKTYEQGEQGNIKFEIITDNLYFPVWEESFEIKTKVNITLEKLISNTQSENQTIQDKIKPKISVSLPLSETKKPEPKIPEFLKENKSEVDVKKSINKDESKDTIKNFDSFFGK